MVILKYLIVFTIAEGYVVRQLIHIVILPWEEALQLLPGMFNSFNESLHQVALLKIPQHEFLRFLPKSGADLRVYAGIPNDSKAVVVNSHVNQHAIPQRRFIHPKTMEIYGGAVLWIVFASGFDG